MKSKIFFVSSIILLFIFSCSLMNLKHGDNKILKYLGEDYEAFQKYEFRIYNYFGSPIREFCDEGILTGDMFYFGRINDSLIFDENGNYSTNKKIFSPERIKNYSTDFLQNFEKDFENFKGHKILLAVPPFSCDHRKGSLVDTLIFEMDVYLIDKTLGHPQRFHFIITCDPLKDIYKDSLKNVKPHKFIYLGGII